MRTVQTSEITKNIREMCIEANHFLSDDMKKVFNESVEKEESPLGKQILNQLKENLEIAGRDMIPICQDTGMAVVFIKVGQEVHIEGGNLTDAINEGVRQGYVDGYLRKSVVRDPIDRVNTKDNTPAIIHYEIVDGDQVDITVAPKGFGSENMSRVFMLKPADGIEGVKEKILEAVRDAGPNACPPMGTRRSCDCHGRQYRDISDAYRGTSDGSEYLLSCKPSCASRYLIRETGGNHGQTDQCTN